MTYNLFYFFTGDPGRETLQPDLLGEMVKIEQGSNLFNQIFNWIARYVWKVHSDEHTHKGIHYNAGRSFLDIIGPSEIAYIVSIIKNSKGVWDQDIRMQGLGEEAKKNPEKRLKPLFTSGSGQKRTQGKSLWNLDGMKYFHQAEKNGSRFMIVRRIWECSTMGGRDGLQLQEQT
jgi:hypothetical protein